MFKLVSPDTNRTITFKPRGVHWFLKYFGDNYWTTMGDVIYYPQGVDDPLDKRYWTTIQHELVHHKQQTGCNLNWWLFKYIACADFRWCMEREAYLVDIENGQSIAYVVKVLEAYHCGSEKMMRDWFEKNCTKESVVGHA